MAVTGQIDPPPPSIFWFSSTPAEIGLRRRILFFSLFVMSHFYTKTIWTCFLCFHFQTITFKTDLRIMIPPGRISDRVIVNSGCTTRSLKFQMPPLLLISRWYLHIWLSVTFSIMLARTSEKFCFWFYSSSVCINLVCLFVYNSDHNS